MDTGTILGPTAFVIDSIKGVYPVKFNGIEGAYEVCQPKDKQGDMIVTEDGGMYFISINATGREALLDIV